MRYYVPERVIQLLCGKPRVLEGRQYVKARRVALVRESTDPVREATAYSAQVYGRLCHECELEIDADGAVSAACDCDVYRHSGQFCKHIAAVLVEILEREVNGEDGAESMEADWNRPAGKSGSLQPADEPSDHEIVDGMLELFAEPKPRPSGAGVYVDNRVPLLAEFTLMPLEVHGAERLGLELKIGLQRLYVVQQIRDFLEHVDRGQPYPFSAHFMYDPAVHAFRAEDDAVIRQLIALVKNEKLYHSSASGYSAERRLELLPFFWESLLPGLLAAPSAWVRQGNDTQKLALSDEALPLAFQLEADAAGDYRFGAEGLDGLQVLEAYGLAVSRAALFRLSAADCHRLAGMKRLLAGSGKKTVAIARGQMEAFLDKAAAELGGLGELRIAESVAERIVRPQLQAKLYLDRVRDRLLAGLEFQYGDIVINPLEEAAGKREERPVLLLRDGEAERSILELMEHPGFMKTESGYVMTEEEGEYDFLYHTIPRLEPLLKVYATTSVKERLWSGSAQPMLRLSWNEKTDWLEIKFDMNGIAEAEIVHVLEALQEKRKYYRLPGGALLPLEGEAFQEILQAINEAGIRAGDWKSSGYTLPLVRGLHMNPEQAEGAAVRFDRPLRQLLQSLRHPDHADFPVPAGLSGVLRDYQTTGYQWLKTLARYGFGGILADDMGLGKTIQSIAFLLSEAEVIRSDGKPALIVAPASLLYNWLNELKRFAPELTAVVADGQAQARSRLLAQLDGVDCVITSYPLLRRDMKTYARLSFHTLILDEAQTIKNHATQTAQAVKALQARHRFALTGTPVENAREDVWSIFNVIMPGLLPGLKAFHDMAKESVARRIRPFLLRRLKRDVLRELPDKIESLQASELLPEQKKLYAAYLARLRKEALKHLDSDTFGRGRLQVLAGLTRLRQLCDHPALFVDGYSGGSAKFEQLLEIVGECRSAGKRALIFSQFTEMLTLIRRALGEQGIPYFYLDGATRPAERIERCRRFNEGEREFFLISLKAGGTGLNLTGADTVILYDLWWNPAVEQQATDRAHRIGQTKAVQVIRLVAQGTVEDKMYELQQKKKDLLDELVQPGHETMSRLTEQDIRELLML